MPYLLDAGCTDADNSFGPSVQTSCRAFDFTLLFEQIFFCLVPAAAFIFVALFRLRKLRQRQVTASGLGLQVVKQVSQENNRLHDRSLLTPFQKVAIFCYATTQLASVILWSTSTHKTDASLASAVLTFLASVLLSPLSYFEEVRSIRPSVVLNVYLIGSILFEAVQVRTLFLTGLDSLGITSSVGLGVKTILLLLEALPKTTLTTGKGANISREDRANVYSLRTFWWINRILLVGRRQSLKLANLDFIGPGLKTERYSSHLAQSWNTVDQNKKYGLLFAVFSTLKWPLLAPAIPRLVLIG